MQKIVSIVIPAFNAGRSIPKAIQGCLDQDYPKENLEIIVVDDGSTDDTRKIVQAYPVIYIAQRNQGPAKARNTGWIQAKGDIICFIDSDCIPERNLISKLTENYTSDEIGAVGGSYGIANIQSLLADCIHREIVYRHSRMLQNVQALGSYNLSVRKSVLEEIGGFNEEYKMASGEDNDLSYRILKKHYLLIFDKDAIVFHYHPDKLVKYLKSQFWHGYWRVKLYREHPDMVKGDDYSNLWDYIQPPLFLSILILFPFSFYPTVRFILMGLLFFGVLLQLPLCVTVIKTTKQLKYTEMIIITFLRNFARGLGLLLGIINFIIIKK